jgi:hypothetical protein
MWAFILPDICIITFEEGGQLRLPAEWPFPNCLLLYHYCANVKNIKLRTAKESAIYGRHLKIHYDGQWAPFSFIL